MWSDEDIKYMRMALDLARKGQGHVDPNPMVGAVIVRDGRVLASGWHHVYGSLHAERDALSACTEPTQGATMYVTLEPCCHFGKQPPCTNAIMEAGISRVVVAMTDPNPLVAGKGAGILRSHGIEVQFGKRGQVSQQGICPIHHDQASVGGAQECRNPGRTHRGCLWRFQMGEL